MACLTSFIQRWASEFKLVQPQHICFVMLKVAEFEVCTWYGNKADKLFFEWYFFFMLGRSFAHIRFFVHKVLTHLDIFKRWLPWWKVEKLVNMHANLYGVYPFGYYVLCVCFQGLIPSLSWLHWAEMIQSQSDMSRYLFSLKHGSLWLPNHLDHRDGSVRINIRQDN